MPDPLTVDIAVAIATLVAPAVFLALLAAAGWRRSRGLSVGPRWSAMVTVIGEPPLYKSFKASVICVISVFFNR